MHFSDDDLRAALRRKDPGPGFTQRVMARIEQAKAQPALRPVRQRRSFLGLWPFKLRPALVSGAVATVLLAGSWLGFQQYERVQREKLVERAAAEKAKQDAILALRITRAKLNRVFQRAKYLPEPGPEVRGKNL